jgi:preprotein translocase subunit SecY
MVQTRVTDTIKGSVALADLRNRILFNFLMFALFILGAHILVPGIDRDALARFFSQSNTLFGILNLFAGGALRRFSIFAMGIAPYINAQIMMQLLSTVIPELEELNKQGEMGRRIISRYTRYLTIALAAFQAFGMVTMFSKSGIIINPSPLYIFTIVLSLTGGTAFLMWMGEQISQKGIGNGVSLIIFIGIVASYPQSLFQELLRMKVHTSLALNFLFFLAIAVLLVAFIVFFQRAHHKIPIRFAQRIAGMRVYGSHQSYLPVMVNQGGVIPIIFAISVMVIPSTIATFVPGIMPYVRMFTASVWYPIVEAILVIAFTYFYAAVVFKPDEIAENLKKNGGFIPGVRPGEATAEYIARIQERVTFWGALFLAVVAIIPPYIIRLTGIKSFWLGGTALLIVVGVAFDTWAQIEAHLISRNYEGMKLLR